MAARLIADDPKAAHAHADAARRRLPRIAVVREAVGMCAYANGDWAEALAELRASKRISGRVDVLPMMADGARGLGRNHRFGGQHGLDRRIRSFELHREFGDFGRDVVNAFAQQRIFHALGGP